MTRPEPPRLLGEAERTPAEAIRPAPTPAEPAQQPIEEPSPPSRGAWIAYAVLLVASTVLLAAIIGAIWQPLFMAAVLAAGLGGWHERLARALRGHRNVSALVMTLATVVLILLPITAVVVVVVREAVGAVELFRGALAQGGVAELVERLPEPIASFLREQLGSLTSGGGVEKLASSGAAAASAIGDVLSRGGAMLVNVVLMLIAFDFLLVDGRKLVDWIVETSPLRGRHMRELIGELRVVVRSVLGSTIITAAVQAVFAMIGYAIAGVPQFVFFGILTFFSAFIPSVGTALVALPLVGLLVILGHPWAALFLGLWSTVAVGLVDNLIRPLLMKDDVGLHGAIVFFSLLGGLAFFGAVGLIAGPIVVALFVSAVRIGKRDFKLRA
ncbi:AI-2E family transporter [Myxococcota bacterium]|nr:AI-2E family transporter [Myxococcota bacterium]